MATAKWLSVTTCEPSDPDQEKFERFWEVFFFFLKFHFVFRRNKAVESLQIQMNKNILFLKSKKISGTLVSSTIVNRRLSFFSSFFFPDLSRQIPDVLRVQNRTNYRRNDS